LRRISLRVEPVENIKGLVADHFTGVVNGLLGYWPDIGTVGKGLIARNLTSTESSCSARLLSSSGERRASAQIGFIKGIKSHWIGVR
jgi:hypothetical protein